jgi:hypothetical protein
MRALSADQCQRIGIPAYALNDADEQSSSATHRDQMRLRSACIRGTSRGPGAAFIGRILCVLCIRPGYPCRQNVWCWWCRSVCRFVDRLSEQVLCSEARDAPDRPAIDYCR